MSEENKQKKQKSAKSNFLGVSIILASLILGGSIIYAFNSLTQLVQDSMIVKQDQEQEITGPEINESDHILGNSSAPVTIVAFSDFQCPFCERFHLIIARIFEEYPSDVRWVYKHFPLDTLHPQARAAAEASECAAEQDKFWEFADKLFEKQSILGPEVYKNIASDLGLSSEQFQNCIDTEKYKDKVEADYQEGIRLGVRGTPGSFINGEQLVGAVPYDSLKSIVEQALEDSR